MAAPRTGSLGVATTKGDIYAINTAEDLDRLPVGADDQVIVADSAEAVGMKWKNITDIAKASFQCDALDAIFKKIDLGGGAIDNPGVEVRGSHSVLRFNAAVLRGIPWQKFMPEIYTDGTDLNVVISWVSNGTASGNVLWGVALERDNGGFDVDAEGFGTLITGLGAATGVAGEIIETTIVLSGAAELDGILKGEPLRLFVQRDGIDGSDDLADAVQIIRVVPQEA